jgi:hypothetical protein
MTMDRESIDALISKLAVLNKEVELRKLSLAKKRMEYTHEESELIYTRECARKIAEQLERLQAANDIASSLDYSRDAEVERYRKAMPESIESIKDEASLPFKSISDLK